MFPQTTNETDGKAVTDSERAKGHSPSDSVTCEAASPLYSQPTLSFQGLTSALSEWESPSAFRLLL